MRIIYITESKPKKILKLDPLDAEDLNIDIDVSFAWSENNKELYRLLLENGMAEYICNREFLFEFYTHLQFVNSRISSIDIDTLKLTNLKILNLFSNQISVLENIPQSCIELYVDFNHISAVKIKNKLKLELISISNNCINDSVLSNLIDKTPNLACLNVGYNRIEDIRKFVNLLKKCTKLKILISLNNPISMLALYWKYVTDELTLTYFDNEKYVKPPPFVPPEPEVEPKKEEKKEEKKDAKKDSKKNAKVEEKLPEPKKEEIKVIKPRELVEEDFKELRFKIELTVLDNVSGSIFEQSIFPPEITTVQQSYFWVEVQFLDVTYSSKDKKVPMDSILPEGDINRLNFEFTIEEKVLENYTNFLQLNQGIIIHVYKEEPNISIDQESGEQKANLNEDKSVCLVTSCVGGTFVSLEELWGLNKKEMSRNLNLFDGLAVKEALFKRPYENEQELISKHRVQFDAKQAAIEEEKKKKREEEEALKVQKKGGKDPKKAPPKKETKKDPKDQATDKKMVQKCTFADEGREYRFLGENKMFKCKKEQLGIKIVIE